MKYIKLAKLASFLDSKGFYVSADQITNKLIKLSQQDEETNQQNEEELDPLAKDAIDENPPFELHEGETSNDPTTVMKYFVGFAFDMFINSPGISKNKINAEVNKKITDKLNEMSDDNKIKFANLREDVMAKLETQPWYSTLQETNESNDDADNQVVFDPSSTGFKNALKYIFDVEGGYSDYNPKTKDPRTNLGIIQSEYDEYRASKGLPQQTVKEITRDEAEEIYFKNYWTKIKAEQIYQSLPKTAITIFDFAVNSGLGGASSLVSGVLGIQSSRFDNQMVDAIIQAGTSQGDQVFSKNLIDRRRINYQEIIRANDDKKDYAKGWQNRLDKLEKFNQ